jgi:hypothetical protein
MRSFRTSLVAAVAVTTLAWSAVGHADDTTKSTKSTSGQTTQHSQHSTTTSGGAQGAGSTTGPNVPSGTTSGTVDPSSPSSPPSGTDTTTGQPGTGTSDPWNSGTTSDVPSTGTSTDSDMSKGMQYGTQPTTQSPYQVQPPPYSSTYSTTTTTASTYDESAGADRAGYSVRPNRPLLITGASIFAATYGATVITAAASSTDSDDDLYIPVAGPWINLADRDCGFGDCGNQEDWENALIIGSGIAQGAGVALALASLFIPEHKEAKTYATKSPHVRSAENSKASVRVLPVSMRAGGGVGAMGQF